MGREERPVTARFYVADQVLGGERQTSLVAPCESRLVWRTALPRRGTLNASVGFAAGSSDDAATFRIAISDDRIYEPLVARTVAAGESARGWIPLAADLSRYAGLKLSLFYRPEGRRWNLILSVNRDRGSPARAFWGWPGVDTDLHSAKRFMATRGR